VRRIAAIIVLAVLIAAACNPDGEQQSAPSSSVEDVETTRPPDTSAIQGADDAEEQVEAGDEEAIPAPEFPAGLDWVNTEAPLTVAGLRGKVVLLDFWTYGCINCIHIIGDLERLEAEYPNELVVIGVHSAKFTNESSTENIKEVVRRYELAHPVVNDARFEIWNAWGARAWPTVALIDPAGNVVGTHAGEGVYEVVEPFVSRLVREFGDRGEIDREPVALSLEQDRAPRTVLSYPGKVLADPAADRLFIADTGHHRIVVTDHTGEVSAVYGSGTRGFADGGAATAQFAAPQGLELSADGDTLYVADTNNHAVRAIDLVADRVDTLAGSGQIGWPPTAGTGTEVDLNSPWALARRHDALFVANAGTHQIWRIDLATAGAEPTVGSSREGTTNGPLAEAALAQPSGLAFDENGHLFFADSESSSIRSAEVLDEDGETGLVAGAATSLFEFGDEDGRGDAARFQHPLGIAWHDGRLLVADTYNSKIKSIDPADGEAATLFGSVQGWADGSDPRFYEPGGLSVKDDLLYVADTNNHVIRVIDLAAGTTETVVVSGIERFDRPSQARSETVPFAEASAAAGPATIVLDIALPEGYKVNEDASSEIVWTETGGVASFHADGRVDLTGTTFPVEIPVELTDGTGSITGDLTLVWCREDAEGLCYLEQRRLDVPIAVAPAGPSSVISIGFAVADPGV